MKKKLLLPRPVKSLLRITAAVAILILLAAVAGCCFMDDLLFPRPHPGARTGNLTLQAGEAELDAYWQPGRPDKPVVLYSHGNGETLATIRGLLAGFAGRGYGVLAYDYAGYGGSTGKAGEEQAYRDIEAAYRYLREDQGITPDRILAVGFSVGGGPSCYLAEKYPLRGLVLCAPFASAVRVVLPFSIPCDRFPNVDRLSRRVMPLLLFHGTADRIVPYRNGVLLAEKARGPVRFITAEEADHNDLYDKLGDLFWTEFERFAADPAATWTQPRPDRTVPSR